VAGVLITGASGLIGRWVTTLAQDSLDLIPLSHHEVDLSQPGRFAAELRRVRPDVLLHLAWTASGEPGYRTHPDNERWLVSSLEAAEECRRLGVHFIGTGSVADRGTGADSYSGAKHQLWLALQADIETGAITWLRPFHVFDPERTRPALVADVREARLAHRPVVLRTPAQRHDFVLAEDVGSAVVTTLTAELTGCVEIGSGTARPVSQLVEALGGTWRAENPDLGADAGDGAADIRRLRRAGWSPVHTERLFRGH
jgi:nucleoside-diphosphate-sugar epimerase